MTQDCSTGPSTGRRPRFAWRAMISVLLACAFFVLLASGLVLFIAPPGRVANWSGWNVLGIDKHGWGGLHIWFAVIFLAASVLHIFYNWRVLIAYFKSRHTRRLVFRLEWAAALLICVGAFAGTRAGVVPFSSLLDFNERVKSSWEGGGARGGGSESRRVTDACATGTVQGCESAATVKEPGAAAASGGHRGGGPGGGGGGGGGGGMGRRTLAEVCDAEKVAVTQAVARLQARGVSARPEQTLREIAAGRSLGQPGEIVNIIRGEAAPAPAVRADPP